MNEIIANAIYAFIAGALQNGMLEHGTAQRHFFRLDGFDDAIYEALLERFIESPQIGGRDIIIRTIAPVSKYDSYALEAGKSATWYRNNVPHKNILLLIFNDYTSDVQSLKDLYRISESLMGAQGLGDLINASFTTYQLHNEDRTVLEQFIVRVRTQLFNPQLRDLVAFLAEAHQVLNEEIGKQTIEDAIAKALPQLGLFRANELVHVINTSKGDRLLSELYRAARLGTELIDEHSLERYKSQLEVIEFEDKRVYGENISPTEKKELLNRFLSDVLTDRNDLLQVLRIDWSEIAPLLRHQSRKTKMEKLQDIGHKIVSALKNQHIDTEDLPESYQVILQEFEDGKQPQFIELTAFLKDIGDSLPKNLRNQATNLIRIAKLEHSDFILGLAKLMTLVLATLENDDLQQASLHVTYQPEAHQSPTDLKEPLLTFALLYGGLITELSHVQWHLSTLFEQVKQLEQLGDDTEKSEGHRTTKLHFEVVVKNRQDEIISQGELNWSFCPSGTQAATLAHYQAENTRLAKSAGNKSNYETDPARLPLPIYNTCNTLENIGNLDLTRPFQSIGTWYTQAPTDLGEMLRRELTPLMDPLCWQEIEKQLVLLETGWKRFIEQSELQGMRASEIEILLNRYESFLECARRCIQTEQESATGFPIIAQAWMVGPASFDQWAIVPFLHPLKLHWWLERTRRFNHFIGQLLYPTEGSKIVNERRFLEDLETVYSSSGYPAIIALPQENQVPCYFLPVHEVNGYELFQPLQQAGLAFGLNPEVDVGEEGEIATRKAANEIAKVVEDYVETYPFVRDGLELYLLKCPNGSLPGLLVESLKHLPLQLNIIVHSDERGANLFRNIKDWKRKHTEIVERPSHRYFPPVTFKVVQSSFDDLLKSVDDTDLVILPDVLAEKGQDIERDVSDVTPIPISLSGYLPEYPFQQSPYEEGKLNRRISLTPTEQPALLHHFYAIHAADEKPVPLNKTIRLSLRVSLRDWKQVLIQLHRHFNWVICYDTSVDRFLLQSTVPDAVEVIRYSLGLGIKRRHNLTVSSAKQSQEIVGRRLTTNLKLMFTDTSDEFREKVAHLLIKYAKQISGDVVLRAAGPGAYLNEIIGMVVAKHLTEQRYLKEHPGALTTWIYLDDFVHWFDGKLPDLLFVAITDTPSGKIMLHIEVLETKCISTASFDSEAKDAQQQVSQGLNRLVQAWRPGALHLDAPYWYNQLYQAVVGNLKITRAHFSLWEAFRRGVPNGNFDLQIDGHTWIFCYDGTAGITGHKQEKVYSYEVADVKNIMQTLHHFSRFGLRQTLVALVEATGTIPVPPAAKIEKPYELEPQVNQIEYGNSQDKAAPSDKTTNSVSSDSDVVEMVEEVDANEASLIKINNASSEKLEEQAQDLMRALRHYNVRTLPIEVEQADIGPSVVRFKVRLRPGEKLGNIQKIAEDLQRELALTSIPLISNVRGTNFIGIDLPRHETETVPLHTALIALPDAQIGELLFPVGQTPAGETIFADLSAFPHLLVSGSTGSGKTIFLYGLILSLTRRFGPDELSLLLIDPKQTDFVYFEKLPHLLGGSVILEPEEAIGWLEQLVNEMLPARTQQLRNGFHRDIKAYNIHNPNTPMKPIVVVIDEYADLVQVLNKSSRQEFERSLGRLAQRARSVGIHLVIATQRPSADIITTSLKANLPVRIAFRLPSYHDSMTILDQPGAENLLGRGDMLYTVNGAVERLQGFYVSLEDLTPNI